MNFRKLQIKEQDELAKEYVDLLTEKRKMEERLSQIENSIRSTEQFLIQILEKTKTAEAYLIKFSLDKNKNIKKELLI